MRTYICIVYLVALTSAYLPGDDKVKRLAAVVNEMAQTFHQKLLLSDVTSLFSPLSIHSAWCHMSVGAGGTTLEEIYDRFQLFRWTGGPTKPHDAYSMIFQEYRNDANGNVTFANYMSVNPGEPVIPKFINSTRNYYLSEVAYHNIADPVGPEKKINDYVKTMTRGFVTEVVKTGTINSTTQVVYVSTFFAALLWNKPFDKTQISKHFFTQTGNKVIEVDMMQDNYRDMKMKTVDGATIGQLPCQGGRYAIYFLLPNQFSSTLAEHEQRLTNKDYMDTLLLNGFTENRMRVKIPKLRIESTYVLNSVLQSMGVVKSFDPVQANFGNVSKTSGAYVTKHIHKVVLEFNENGTAPIPGATYQKPPFGEPTGSENFELTHPFLFFLRDKPRNIIIFQGKYTGK